MGSAAYIFYSIHASSKECILIVLGEGTDPVSLLSHVVYCASYTAVLPLSQEIFNDLFEYHRFKG